MPLRTLAASLLAFLVLAAPAVAADPIMPLSDVRAGMQCTGLTVVRGTEVSAFAVEVLDVVAGEAVLGPRILIRVSGPAVDETGIGPGFSGSPILCPDAQGVARNAGAISEAIGEYGGKVVLATPIEAILGSPVRAPRAPGDRTLLTRARPLTAPLTISGLGRELGMRLQREAARRGQVLLAAPPGPLGSFPRQQLRPGSAFGVSYSSGDIHLSATGTVVYVDGDAVWGFGHQFQGYGGRALFLQDAYVFRVINNPFGVPGIASSYKLASTGHDLGTITNDTRSAVVGSLGALPASVPVRVRAVDLDANRRQNVSVDVADERGADEPEGTSALSFLAPIAAGEAASQVLQGSPARLTARACVRIRLRQLRRPAGFCNRYVTDSPDLSGLGNAVGASLASDMISAFGLIDGYKLGPLQVTGVSVRMAISRGQRLAYLRAVRLPRRVRAGRPVRATLVLRHVRGPLERRRVTLRMPKNLQPGRRRIRLTGYDVDFGGIDFLSELSFLFGDESGGSAGPPNVERLARAIRRIGRYDGVRIRSGSQGSDESAGRPAYRDPRLRIGGRASARVRVVKG